jgi:RNA-directed DNA polymerase
MHHKPGATGQWLRRVVQGHINYYGVPFNPKSLNLFVQEVTKAWLWSLRRRSQRHRMNWKRFKSYDRYWIPNPQIVHPYPEQRFYPEFPGNYNGEMQYPIKTVLNQFNTSLQ